MSDEELIERIKSGSSDAAAELLHRFGPLIRYIASPIAGDRFSVEECVSDTVLRVLAKADAFDEERGSLRSFVAVIARRAAIDCARRASEADGLSEDMVSSAPTPEEALLKKEQAKAINLAISSLSFFDRSLFYRKYFYLQPVSQIAAELSLSERAVEGRLYRIRKKLQKKLGGEFLD